MDRPLLLDELSASNSTPTTRNISSAAAAPTAGATTMSEMELSRPLPSRPPPPSATQTAGSTKEVPHHRSGGAGDDTRHHQEWIFSIRVPCPEPTRNDSTQPEVEVPLSSRMSAGGAQYSETTTTTPLLQLKQAQFGHDDDVDASPSRLYRRRRRESEEIMFEQQQVLRERASLLPAEDSEEEECSDDDPSNVWDNGGWTFQSPYWNLHSNDLLRITYYPAWQALPAYTNTSSSKYFSCGGSTMTSSCCGSRPMDYSSYTYTSNDIVRVEQLPKYEVTGIGVCQAIRLYLPPLPVQGDDNYASIPYHLQDAWHQQLHHIQQNRIARGLPVDAKTSEENQGPILTICLPTSQVDAPLLWKVHVPPLQHYPIALETITVLNNAALIISQQQHPLPTHIYINGYQSWSFAGSIPRGHPQPTSAMPNVFSRAFNYGGSIPPPSNEQHGRIWPDSHLYEYESDATTPPSPQLRRPKAPPMKVHYTSDFFTCITSDGPVPASSRLAFLKRYQWYNKHHSNSTPYQLLDETGGPALLLGWLSQRHQFGVITSNQQLQQFQMHASCHGQLLVHGYCDPIQTDWAYAQLISNHSYDEEPMVHYLHAVAACNHARPLQNGSLLTGWCSWYFAYERISARLLRDNFATLAGMKKVVPTNVSVVDDGYMSAWGDWDSVKERQFPDGMDVVSRDISQHGMRPGLWMAPFAADKHSKIAAQHPKWIIRNHAGAVANSANCGKFFYGLDATNPQARDYVHHCVSRAADNWGFNVLKIDFLYAACLEGNGKFDLSMSRAEAMDLALRTIRDAAGSDTFLIGCGCPIATAIGLVDAMRISADTGPTWYPPPPLPWYDMGTLPSLRSMVRNSISRAPLGHRWWHNDPDCVMVGEHTRLTNDEVASAASVVAMTCGMLLLSDDLPKVPAARTRILSKIFPMTGVSAVVLDLHSTNNGLPSLMRLWCTDKYQVLDQLRRELSTDSSDGNYVFDHNAEATYLARQASFRPDEKLSAPDERKRSCIHVTKGLGTWTVLSISNWLDKPDVVHIPPPALLPAPVWGWGTDSDDGSRDDEENRDYGEHGYHVLAFWSSRYQWLAPLRRETTASSSRSSNDVHGHDPTISKQLGPHATEIFHIKPVTPESPQYIGSDLHFSCGRELRSFRATRDTLTLKLSHDYQRAGRIFVFIPRVSTDNLRVMVHGAPGRWTAIGNTPKVNENGSPRLLGRIIAIPLIVRADGSPNDGCVKIEF